MLQLLQSNQMSHLVGAFVARAQENENPFIPSTIVVQSFGIGQWLKLQVAAKTGIAANIDCILPAKLIWDLHKLVLDRELPDENPFSVERITWHLMRRLPHTEVAPVQHFLAGPGDPQVRQFQLSEKIGALFDQYLIYRPEWILGWERRDPAAPDSWQAALWRDLVADPRLANMPHRASLHAALIDRLSDPTPIDDLPEQISVFGLSSLPPLHLETLRVLSERIDVDIYFLNPCQHYWGDIVSPKDKARRSIRNLVGSGAGEPLTEDDYIETGNPLLSSFGRQGREFIEQLLEIDEISEDESFEPFSGSHMLERLKNDMLELTFGGEYGTLIAPSPAPVAESEANIAIHVCHSKMREVEVLHDQLLAIMKDHPDIGLRDIIVMMPDVGEYAPFIEAVFKGTWPYTIADRSLDEESPILVAFRTLLTLPDLRLTATEVMDLLEIPTISRRLGLLEEDLVTLTRWIDESGIRWELDGNEKASRWQLPADDSNTWRFGLDRLLLGLAMEPDAGPWQGILPLPVTGADSELLGKLCDFIELLGRYRMEMSRMRRVGEWRECILRLCDDFFDARGQEELDLARVRDLCIEFESEITATGYEEPLSQRMVQFWFNRQLSISQQARGFISGGITFATLVPMRSIPFKAVCLLGMNDGAYPREERPVTFDLMHKEGRRRGDRSKRDDDRYLFLEALVSAQDYFYVSYTGRGMKDNEPRPPSVLVGELLDYCQRVFDHDPVVEHPLQPFGREYYLDEFPRHVTFRNDWFEALCAGPDDTPFADVALDPPEELTLSHLDQLRQFMRHPARYYLRGVLDVYFQGDEEALTDCEPFTLDALERYQLADSALVALVNGTPPETWESRMVASGQVMHGELGVAQLDREFHRASVVFETISEMLNGEAERLQGTVDIEDVQLSGTVGPLFDGRLINYRSGTLRKRQLLEAWITHLFACSLGREIETFLVSAKNGKADVQTIAPLSADDARAHLATLTQLYRDGTRLPLKFMPETSYTWFNLQQNGSPETVIANRTVSSWYGTEHTRGAEGQDPNYARLFSFPADLDDEFRSTAATVYGPLREHWSGK
jgi:exodeoxyribonuclease V gamma subunit